MDADGAGSNFVIEQVFWTRSCVVAVSAHVISIVSRLFLANGIDV